MHAAFTIREASSVAGGGTSSLGASDVALGHRLVAPTSKTFTNLRLRVGCYSVLAWEKAGLPSGCENCTMLDWSSFRGGLSEDQGKFSGQVGSGGELTRFMDHLDQPLHKLLLLPEGLCFCPGRTSRALTFSLPLEDGAAQPESQSKQAL